MRSGTCPKCQSTDVRMTTMVNTDLVPSVYQFDTYVCPACGYYEHYVADLSRLAQAAAAWPLVSR
jgi:predicted nucleic-acid-binding Zn-ribbon protein